MTYIYIDGKDTIQISKNYLMKCLALLKENELDCKAILIALRALNELSYIELIMENITESISHLSKALKLYLIYTKEKDDYPVPIDVASILSIEDKINCRCLLERICQITLIGLLDLTLSSEQTDTIKTALTYMHKRLNKQLETEIYDYSEWIINSTMLSSCLIKYGRLTEARNHLAAATFILQKYFADICQQVENKNLIIIENIARNRYKHASAFITVHWAKYGLALLNLSKERAIIRNRDDNEANNLQSSKSGCSTKSEMQPKDLLIFSDIEKDLEEFDPPITDKCPLNYEEAKKVFVNILKWFNDVKRYVMNDNIIIGSKILNELEIAIDISRAYRYLAHYEQDKSKKIKLYKRQIDGLEKALKTIDPIVQIEILKWIHLELIFSYSTIVDIITDHLHADKSLTEEELSEVNQFSSYCLNSLKLYVNLSMN